MANGRKLELDQEVEMQEFESFESDEESSSESEENHLVAILPQLPRQHFIDPGNIPAFHELGLQQFLINNINIVNLFPIFSIWDSGKKIDFLAKLPTILWINIFDRLDDKTTLQLSSTCKTMRSLFRYKFPQEKNYEAIDPQENSSLAQLPDELILFIYKLLDVKSTLHLSMTCKLLSNLVDDIEIRFPLFIKTFNLLKPKPSFDNSELLQDFTRRNRDLFNNYPVRAYDFFRGYQPAHANQDYGRFFNRALPARYEQIDWVPEESERATQLTGNNNQ